MLNASPLACGFRAARHSYRFPSLGTWVSFTAFGNSEIVESCFQAGRSECLRYEQLLSRTIPSSDVSRINGSEGGPVRISEETFQLLAASLAYCERSLGLFDITMGSVTRLWDFRGGTIPSQAEIEAALRQVDYRRVKLDGDAGNRLAWIEGGGGAIDLGGIAKGYIADMLADLFSKRGLPGFVINLGGNVITRGNKPDGSCFRIGIMDPCDKSKVVAKMEIENMSVVTSGPAERSFVKKGKRYHHILDPRTGFPVETDVESVTLIAPKSLDCDGFSSTVCALGLKRGLAFASTLDEIEKAILVDQGSATYIVP